MISLKEFNNERTADSMLKKYIEIIVTHDDNQHAIEALVLEMEPDKTSVALTFCEGKYTFELCWH